MERKANAQNTQGKGQSINKPTLPAAAASPRHVFNLHELGALKRGKAGHTMLPSVHHEAGCVVLHACT
mgnify:CR=1 FL=1